MEKPSCLACTLMRESPDSGDYPPHTCAEASGRPGQQPQELCAGIGSNDTPSEDNSPSTSDFHTAPQSAATSPNSLGFYEPFARDLLNVLNACTRLHYQANSHTVRLDESTFANAMNSYLESGGDRNVGNVYETARAMASASNEGYRFLYPFMRKPETRDVGVNTEFFFSIPDSDEDEEFDVEEYALEDIEEEEADDKEEEEGNETDMTPGNNPKTQNQQDEDPQFAR